MVLPDMRSTINCLSQRGIMVNRSALWTAIFVLAFMPFQSDAFSRNAPSLGLVSKDYPIEFWDALARMKEEELNPEFRHFIVYLDQERAGNEHWCCHSGRTVAAKVPVYNNRGEVVAWNSVPCEKVGCCEGYLEVANHCLDKNGQRHLLSALDVTRQRLSVKDTTDLIALLKQGGSGIIG